MAEALGKAPVTLPLRLDYPISLGRCTLAHIAIEASVSASCCVRPC